jgi:hypothetical protein
MSHTWKLLPLVALAVFGAFIVFASSSPQVVQADIGSVDVDGSSIDSGDDVAVADGDSLDIEVNLSSPRPATAQFSATGVGADTTIEFNFGDCDDNSGASADDCDVDTGDGTDELVVEDPTAATPAGLQRVAVSLKVECDAADTLQVHIEEGAGGGGDEFTFDVVCGTGTATPTATTTSTAARTVVVQTANQSLGCANTTIITITVRGANGQPVAAGTLVQIQASIGAVSPTSGQTTADGSVFVFYTAPQNQGGTATITALAGSASGSTTITVNCNVAPTQAPPPTTVPGAITPPSTGDGGISGGGGWQTYAGIAMIVASVIATLVVVRPRA